MSTRRSVLLAGVALAVTGNNSAKDAAMSLVDLSALGKALGDAADAIGKLGDSVAHLASLGQQGWDAVSARTTRNRLRDISARLTILSQYQNVRVIENLDEYIREAQLAPSPYLLQSSWSHLLKGLVSTLGDVKALLGDLEKERSDLVTQSVYQDLIETLGNRASLLDRLLDSPAPTSPQEIQSLQVASANYKTLRENLLKAIQAINTYIHDPTDSR
jgi:hypothetical protein